MQPRDVVRGCFHAYLAGTFPHVALLAIPAAQDGADAVLAITALIVIVGAMAAVPFAGAAFIVYAVLRVRSARIAWWMVPLITTSTALISLSYLIVQAPDPMAPVGYAMFMGLLTGVVFWMGAVGRHWSATAVPAAVENHSFRDKVMK